MSRWIGVLALVALTSAACGGDGPQAPAGPSGSPGPSSAAQGARILGNVSAGQPLAAMAAQVVGTPISSPVNSTGGFSLENVPAGAVQLRFVGSGVDAAVGLTPVQSGDIVSVLVGVSGSTAMIQAEARNTGGKIELEGRIESLPPTQEPDTLVVAGRTVKTSATTQIRDGNNSNKTFGDLVIGQRVHVRGTLVTEPTSAILADSIVIQNTNTWIPVNVNGIVESLNATAATPPYTFTFKIGSRFIQGDLSTKIYGDNDVPLMASDLKNGQRVEVKGEQGDNFVYAVRIHINGLGTTPQPPQDDSASVEGRLESINGTKPNLTLVIKGKVDGMTVETTVTTTSATVVRRRGDVQTLDALAIGQTVHAVGTRMADKSIDAKMLQIKDDEPDGAFVIEGSLGGLKGTCPAISFGVNGYTVKTTLADTKYFPEPSAKCEDLKSGSKIEVEGTRQADGTVLALKVTKK